MEYIYSALLLHKAGKAIEEDSIKKVLEAAGVNVDIAKVKSLLASLEGVDIEKAIESQQSAIHVVPSQAQETNKKEEKKESPKKQEDEKKQEEEAAAGLSSLFG